MKNSVLRLLGTFSLHTPACRDGIVMGRKGRALIALAALHGDGWVSRRRLTLMLWPDRDEAGARNALRQCLHHVRTALGPQGGELQTQGDLLGLKASSWDIDAWEFLRLARLSDRESLCLAASLFHGELAEDLTLDGEFHEWLCIERERLRTVALGVVSRLAQYPDEDAQHAAAQLLLKLIAADPLDEACYRILMALHARAGLTAKALRVWERCRTVLRRELDVNPSPQTVEVYEQLISPVRPKSSSRLQAATPEPNARTSPARTTGKLTRESTVPSETDHLLRGWQLFSQYVPHSNVEARRAFEAALRAEPNCAEAHVRIGWTHFFDYVSGWSADSVASLRCAESAAESALSCSPDHATAHSLLGKIRLWQMNHQAALRSALHGLELAPRSAYAFFHVADITMWCGELDKSHEYLERALALNPNDHGVFLTIEGMTQFFAGNLSQARNAVQKAAIRNPNYSWALAALAAIDGESGRVGKARQACGEARVFNRRLSLDFARRVLPIRSVDSRQKLIAAWRVAGMPDEEDCRLN